MKTLANHRIIVLVTVDTEPDNVWANHLSTGVRNLCKLRQLQDLLDRYGARATLLITHTIATDAPSVDMLKRLQEQHGAEIGAHLHPWDNPPFHKSGMDRRYHTFPHELDLFHFRRKMEVLTEAIAGRFGWPTAYRAGRYGFVAPHVPVLEELGYIVDSSVTPLCSWRAKTGLPRGEGGTGGIDYRSAPIYPYRLSYDDVRRPGDAELVEFPVTVYATCAAPEWLVRAFARLPQKVQGAFRCALGHSLAWARPTGQPDDFALRMLSARLQHSPTVVNMMFHSSELAVGCSPSTLTQPEVNAVFGRIDKMLLALARRSDVDFMTLSEAARTGSVSIASLSLGRPR